jgi:adenylate cyclase, class 2
MAHGNREVEIKLAIGDPAAARRRLRAAGFRVYRRRVFESNTVFDTPDLVLRTAASLLRVRRAGSRNTLTFKGPPVPSRHKSREELEVELSDAGKMGAILERTCLRPVFRYEKYRTEFRQPGSPGTVTLDETPIGWYLELEGAARWIDRTARTLGFSDVDYITASYGRLYQEWQPRRGEKPADMVFGKRKVRPGGCSSSGAS